MKAHILTIGDELLIGQVVNTNGAWLGEQLTLRLKYSYSEYENDGPWAVMEETCPEGVVQPTAIPAASHYAQRGAPSPQG